MAAGVRARRGRSRSSLAQDAPKRRNAIIFVADGLRHGSVNPIDTPALYRIRTEGVYFANSHAVFPTQTMPNAAAIATGHYPGDTGQFANQIFIGYPLFLTGNSRPACRHNGPRRRRSVRARGPQPAVRRQLPARSVAARVCAFLRLQHGRARKDRACRSAGCDGSGRDSRNDARAGHDHSRRGDRHAAHGAAERRRRSHC